MLLNAKQLRILEIINSGNTTGESIASEIGSSMQMIRYYLDTLSEDGYLKAAKVYDNATREFQVVRAYLTDKGKAALVPASQTEVSDRPAIENLDQVMQSVTTLQSIVEKLPIELAEVLIVYVQDLQTELREVDRRKPQRIKAYFLALLSAALPVIEQTGKLRLFIENARFLSSKLGVSVKLPNL